MVLRRSVLRHPRLRTNTPARVHVKPSELLQIKTSKKLAKRKNSGEIGEERATREEIDLTMV